MWEFSPFFFSSILRWNGIQSRIHLSENEHFKWKGIHNSTTTTKALLSLQHSWYLTYDLAEICHEITENTEKNITFEKNWKFEKLYSCVRLVFCLLLCETLRKCFTLSIRFVQFIRCCPSWKKEFFLNNNLQIQRIYTLNCKLENLWSHYSKKHG